MKPFLPGKKFLRLIIRVFVLSLFPAFSFAQTDAWCGTTLTSSPGCFNTAGTLPVAATYTTITTLGCGAANDDVWYSFTAASSNPTITLSTVTVANVRVQLFTGICGAAMTSVACGTTSIAATGLTPGSLYYIRISSTTNATGTFNICITNPNDLCDVAANSVLLTSGTVCNNIL